jgi:hypothetical protein
MKWINIIPRVCSAINKDKKNKTLCCRIKSTQRIKRMDDLEALDVCRVCVDMLYLLVPCSNANRGTNK